MEPLVALSLSDIPGFIYTALGLGFVIFVHELGHFAVAKWCGVRVERFSIGFGPVILSAMKGETEYALSIIPFGGYVKMLGQDDIDPNQMASDVVAKDPRSYTAKTVFQRMAIISAGVIMNLITGTMMFCAAFMMGLNSHPSIIGTVDPGSPAWVAGIQPGDTITNIDGYKIVTFSDVMRRVTLSWEQVDLQARHHDGTEYREIIRPYRSKDNNRAAIGITRAFSLKLVKDPKDPKAHIVTGSAAAEADPPLMPGDTIRKVDGHVVKDHFEFREELLKNPDKELEFVVDREKPGQEKKKNPEVDTITVKVPPNPMRTLGLMTDIGQVTAVRKGSPADGKIMLHDKITQIETEDGKILTIGKDLNPLRLPDVLGKLHGKKVTIHVKRDRENKNPSTEKFTLKPEDRPGWSEAPFDEDSPMSIPSIGVTCNVLHTVISVDENGPADGLVKPKDQITSVDLLLPAGMESDGLGDKTFTMNFENTQRGWPYLFWLMQAVPHRTVKMTVKSQGTSRNFELKPQQEKDWFTIERGVHFNLVVDFHRDDNLSVAVGRSVAETRNFIGEIYLILYNLFTGRLSIGQLQGPIRIVGTAVAVSNEGFASLLFFLAYLSINLAVLNFLPIPVLDGGHMAFLLYEGIFRKAPSERVLILLTWIGLILIGSLMLTVIGLDLLHTLGLRK